MLAFRFVNIENGARNHRASFETIKMSFSALPGADFVLHGFCQIGEFKREPEPYRQWRKLVQRRAGRFARGPSAKGGERLYLPSDDRLDLFASSSPGVF